MSLHDPLCPAATRCPECGCKRCECILISTVRADQAEKSFRDGYNAHAAGQIHAYNVYGIGSREAAENRP